MVETTWSYFLSVLEARSLRESYHPTESLVKALLWACRGCVLMCPSLGVWMKRGESKLPGVSAYKDTDLIVSGLHLHDLPEP